MTNPLISIIVPTYNRPDLLKRCVHSILNQTYTNIEILIVNDASTDAYTRILLKELEDNSRIRVIHHSENKGVTGASNTGFNNMKGEWFTLIGDDDEMLPNAIEKMLNVLSEVSSSITSISCNCIDTSTGEFSGRGLNSNQYLSREDVISKCSGEHWGLTKTSLLGDLRLNEEVRGGEGALWFKINKKANKYYIHEALRIYHTEGEDRICRRPLNIKELAFRQHCYSKIEEFSVVLQKHNRNRYCKHIFYLSLYYIDLRHFARALKAVPYLLKSRKIKFTFSLLFAIVFGVNTLQRVINISLRLKNTGKH